MHKLTAFVVMALCMLVSMPSSVSARDDGRYANSPLKTWFDQLASKKGLCCSFADGVSGSHGCVAAGDKGDVHAMAEFSHPVTRRSLLGVRGI